jgi:hypothetical protein
MSEILWSLAWAVALCGTAFWFKRNPTPAWYWIESAIFVGAITHSLWNYERRPCRRSSAQR